MLNSEVAYEGSYKNVLHGCTEIHTNGEQFAPLTWMPQSILITCLFLISVFRLLLIFCSLLMNVWTLEFGGNLEMIGTFLIEICRMMRLFLWSVVSGDCIGAVPTKPVIKGYVSTQIKGCVVLVHGIGRPLLVETCSFLCLFRYGTSAGSV